MVFHVLRQRSGPLEPFSAYRAKVWFPYDIAKFAGMLASVLGEVRTFREAHSADVANVWFVEQMSPRVALEINQNATYYYSEFGQQSLTYPQLTGVGEFLFAHIALKARIRRWIF